MEPRRNWEPSPFDMPPDWETGVMELLLTDHKLGYWPELGGVPVLCDMGSMLECVGTGRLDQLSWVCSMERQAEELSV